MGGTPPVGRRSANGRNLWVARRRPSWADTIPRRSVEGTLRVAGKDSDKGGPAAGRTSEEDRQKHYRLQSRKSAGIGVSVARRKCTRARTGLYSTLPNRRTSPASPVFYTRKRVTYYIKTTCIS